MAEELIGMAFYTIPGQKLVDIRRVRLLDNPTEFVNDLHSSIGYSISEGIKEKIQNFVSEGGVRPALQTDRWGPIGRPPLYETGALIHSMRVTQLGSDTFFIGIPNGIMHPDTGHLGDGSKGGRQTPITMANLAHRNIVGDVIGNIPSRPFFLQALDERDIQNAYARNVRYNFERAFFSGLRGLAHTIRILKRGFKF